MLASYPSVGNKAFATTLFPAHAYPAHIPRNRSGEGEIAATRAPLGDEGMTLGRLPQLGHVVPVVGVEEFRWLAKVDRTELGLAPTVLSLLKGVLLTQLVLENLG